MRAMLGALRTRAQRACWMSGSVGGITGGLLAAFSIRVAQACASVGAASAFALQAAFALGTAFFRVAALHGHAGRGCAPLGLRARFFLACASGAAPRQQTSSRLSRRKDGRGQAGMATSSALNNKALMLPWLVVPCVGAIPCLAAGCLADAGVL